MKTRPRAAAAAQRHRRSLGTVAVAYSAGRDSTALLHATAHAAAALGIEVVALHVHHGLMPQADDWLERARRTCQRWARSGLPLRFDFARLSGRPARGESVEAWARRHRRDALAALARRHGADLVLVAHHRRDRAETVLLQALRGAGAAGLAAMPHRSTVDGITWCRPWLDQPREAIDAYCRTHRLRTVDDPSNADPRFARSRLRAQVWSALTDAFGDAETALAAVAARAHEADAVLAEVAASDLATLLDPPLRLRVTPWLQLSAARRANVLRVWLKTALDRAPEALVQRLLDELPRVRSGRFSAGAGQLLQLHRGHLSALVVASGDESTAGTLDAATGRDDAEPKDHLGVSGHPAEPIDLSRPGRYALPQWRGALEVTAARRGAVPARLLCRCELRPRSGGEQFQSSPGGVPRSLKKQYQAAGVAAWQRDGPLVYADGRLLFVPGLGIDARWLVAGDRAGRRLTWRPESLAAAGMLQRNS